MDKVKQTYQALWKKAFRDGEVWIQLESRAKATRLRFELYNAVKEVRQGKVDNPELLAAVSACVVRVEDSGRLGILGKEREDALASILEQVDLQDFIEKAVSPEEASLARLKALMQDIPEAPQVNPYYTRES